MILVANRLRLQGESQLLENNRLLASLYGALAARYTNIGLLSPVRPRLTVKVGD